jgi:uncharacterized protein (TIGR00295 family)
MSDLPSYDECIQILKNQGCPEKVISHCQAVCDLSVKIAEKAEADVKKVEVGALLHDIGRCKTPGILHAVKGAKIVKKLGLPDKIVQIVRNHIGAGLDKLEAKKLGLPYEDFIPVSLEEKIVCHADNLIDDDKRQPVEAEVEQALEKDLKNYALRLVKLHKELSDICGIDLNKI